MGLLYSLRSTIPDFRNACSRVLRVSAFRSPMRRGGGSCCATYHAADEDMCGRIVILSVWSALLRHGFCWRRPARPHRFQNLGDLRNKQADIAVDRNKLEA